MIEKNDYSNKREHAFKQVELMINNLMEEIINNNLNDLSLIFYKINEIEQTAKSYGFPLTHNQLTLLEYIADEACKNNNK